MFIGIVTPAKARAVCGNRATATRWAGFLRQLGHKVAIVNDFDGTAYDLLIALHAWRSAAAIQRFDARYPEKPLIVALTGTDLYRFIRSNPGPTLRSIELADRLIVLHDLAHQALPESVRGRINVVYQSAIPLKRRHPPARRTFDICVVGHLRDEKDPLRPAYAARRLPPGSSMRVLHYGKAHSDEWAKKAHDEMARNPRYHWLGERPHWQVRQAYARCRAMVLPSVMEGGANVISEAAIAGLPVIASDIPGSIGLLGENYAGYYPVQDTGALRDLLLRTESETEFLPQLRHQIEQRAKRFTAAREMAGLQRVLQSVC